MIGGLIKAGVKLVAKELTGAAANNAGVKIGEAIGTRIAARIYTPPPEAKTSEDETPKTSTVPT